MTRREFFQKLTRSVGFFMFGGVVGKLLTNSASSEPVWQIDPSKCQQCGNCATHCVLPVSAVRCVHEPKSCGYCKICSGFFPTNPPALTEGAENQQCPTGAIGRKYIEEPYFEYTVDRELCIGCARCVKGCTSYGNGSLYMQVQRDLCLDCNECSIARVCEGDAFRRIAARQQYLPKGGHGE